MSIISDIIQEAGKRGKTTDPKVQKLVALTELTEADLKEANDVLTWLKEQGAVKTEDGIGYPTSAFAYVPDKEKPSEWKLRLWEGPEKKVTRAQLGRAAAALSPGGFSGQRVDIPAADLPGVKRKIRAEYRKLDVPDEEIPRWVKESEVRNLLNEYIPLTEAIITTKGKANIVVLSPGFNSSKERYYPPETLARDFAVFEGLKMYADHPTDREEKERPERSVRDWVATLKNVKVNDKHQIIGEAVVVEPWMQEKLATLRDKNLLSEMGVSINAVGQASKQTIEGTKTNFIEKIVRGRSVDFVTEAGAGGLVQMFESGPEYDVDIISAEVLKERRPDLVKIIETEVKARTLQEVKKLAEQEEKIKELETNIVTLTTERDGLKVKITESEKAQKKAEAKSVIDKVISESNLPAPSKIRLTESFKDAETASVIAEAIKKESEYVKSITEAGKVKGMGPSQTDSEVTKKALRESGKRLHPEYSEAQLDTFVAGR